MNDTQGETRSQYEALRQQIIHCLAQIEALIDFGEGEDIEDGVFENGAVFSLQFSSLIIVPITLAKAEASALFRKIENYLSDSRRGELMRSGIKIAIFGPPNAGKSSLFNYLGSYNVVYLYF